MTEAQIAQLALILFAKYGPVAAEAFLKLIQRKDVTVPDVQQFLAECEAMDFWKLSGLAPVEPFPRFTPSPGPVPLAHP